MQRIGQYLRALRLSKRNPIEEVAAYLNVAPSLLTKIERGHIHATKHQIFQLATFFGVDAREMLICYQRDRILAEIKDNPGRGALSSRGKIQHRLIQPTGTNVKRYYNMMHELSLLRESQLQIKAYKLTYPLQLYLESIVSLGLYYCLKHWKKF